MSEVKLSVPDFLVWHCAGCGAPAVGTKKPCDCLTNVGTREGPNGKREQTFWDAPPDPSDTTISRLRAALAVAEGALEPFTSGGDNKWWTDDMTVVHTERRLTVGDLRRARTALDEIRKAKG